MDYESLGFKDDSSYLPNLEYAPMMKLTASSSDLNITQFLTTVNRTVANRTGADIHFIVIHYTSNQNDTAKANCNYFYNTDRQASAHYFVDQNDICQCAQDKDIAWHCGTASGIYYSPCRNSNSIGIEMCTTYANGVYSISGATRANTIKLVKNLMDKYKIDTDHVIRHYDVTHKNCPAPWVENDALWESFKQDLTSESEELTLTQYEELKQLIEQMQPKVYHYTNELPEYAKETMQFLMDKGYYAGASASDLNLPETMMRTLVVLYRAGVFKK